MIILGKYKDYYDYMVGVYGRDEGVVYDRRDAYVPNGTHDYDNSLWCPNKIFGDIERDTKIKNRWFLKFNEGDKYFDYSKPHGNVYFATVEVGCKRYLFSVERYLENGKVNIEPKLLEITDIAIEDKDKPYPVVVSEVSLRRGGKLERNRSYINVLLRDTWITKFIDPETAYNEIYNYLIAIKDKKIIDTRTDVQKAESHGFNKESFRNPIRVKDLK